MNTIRSILASILLVLLVTPTAGAATVASSKQINVKLNDGRTVVIRLEQRMTATMTVTPDALSFIVVSSADPTYHASYEISLADVSDTHTVTEADETTAIDGISATSAANVVITPIDAETVVISGSDVSSGADIRVFDPAGHAVNAVVTPSDRGFTLSLSTLTPGVYIINASGSTLKFLKR